ncbi:PepSY domain-containing protein [Paracoccus aerius]
MCGRSRGTWRPCEPPRSRRARGSPAPAGRRGRRGPGRGHRFPLVEIRLPRPGQAWVVREYDRRWPTQVDTVAIHPDTLQITSRADFATFTLIPKLIRWGIDAHMGVLFGVANQILMAGLAIGLMVMIVYGYRMWWTRRPVADEPLWKSWRRLSAGQRVLWAVLAVAVGWALPVLGVSLALFVARDLLQGRATG